MTHEFYITKVDIDAAVGVMRDWIESQGEGVRVVDLEEIPQHHKRFKSFKLVIRKKDAENIRDWLCRKEWKCVISLLNPIQMAAPDTCGTFHEGAPNRW